MAVSYRLGALGWPLCARNFEALRFRRLGPQDLRAAHGGSPRRVCSPSVVYHVRRPHHQGGDLSGISLAIHALTADKARWLGLRLAVAAQQLEGLRGPLPIGP